MEFEIDCGLDLELDLDLDLDELSEQLEADFESAVQLLGEDLNIDLDCIKYVFSKFLMLHLMFGFTLHGISWYVGANFVNTVVIL